MIKIVKKQKMIFLSFFLICSIVLAIFWQTIFDTIMRAQLQLDKSSIIYKMWVKNPLPIYLEVYLFNFTNAKKFEIDKRKVIPDFKEIGPFFFEESREKTGVVWNDLEETVTFNQTKKWKFLPEKSEDFSVRVTSTNPIALTIAHISRLWKSKLQREISNELLNRYEPLFITASAQDWIFNGVSDKFLEMFESLRKVTDIPIPYNKFGWFYDRNMSSTFDGVFTINTGKSNVHDIGMMVYWNNKSKTDHYEDECAQVFGSTGEIIPPLKLFQESLSVFSSEICSYVTFKYKRMVNVEGLDAYEYEGDESVFDNGTLYPENRCFYLGESSYSGVRNVSSCRYGSPAFISFPHFYLADSSYIKTISGMNPDEKRHKFSLKVEPTTGVPLEVQASFQINFRLATYSWCDEFSDVPVIYIPMIWFRQTVNISQEYARNLWMVLIIRKTGSYVFIGFSVLILFIQLTFWHRTNLPKNSL